MAAVFAQTTECRVSLYFTVGCPCPLKIAPSLVGRGLPSNTWFLRPTRVLNLNSIYVGLAVFARLTTVTDKPHYSVGN